MTAVWCLFLWSISSCTIIICSINDLDWLDLRIFFGIIFIFTGITVHHVNCPIGHDSASLCCKSGEDFDHYYRTIEEGRHYK